MTRLRGVTKKTFSSLRVRNYRLYFFGQFVSMTGTWMQSLAQGWLVYNNLSNKDPNALGTVVALQFLPYLLFGAWGGVLADRFDKRKTLMVTQTLMGIFAATLAALTISHVITLWMVYALAFLTGAANAADNPARQAFVSEMVGSDELANAVALNSAMFNAARIIGPAVGGVLIATVGIGSCFAYNSLSFVAMLIGLSLMRTDELFRGDRVTRAKGQVREGLRYAWHDPVLRSTLLVIAVVGTMALNYTVVLPVFAKSTFNGDAGTFGLMTSCMGVGALVGALVTASRSKPTPLFLVLGCVGFGVTMTATAAAPSLVTALPLLILTGAASMAFLATANSTLQLSSSDAMRGRVMALYGLLLLGSTPVGGKLVGWIVADFGARYGLAVGGLSTLAAGLAAAVSLMRSRRQFARAAVGAGTDPLAEPAAA